jgi:hypothetical protein
MRITTPHARARARRAAGYCYDCGRALTSATPLDAQLVVCAYWEIIAPDEPIGPITARWRRAIHRWHSATQDPLVAGWRRQRTRPRRPLCGSRHVRARRC